jgi:hypothetical protein
MTRIIYSVGAKYLAAFYVDPDGDKKTSRVLYDSKGDILVK